VSSLLRIVIAITFLGRLYFSSVEETNSAWEKNFIRQLESCLSELAD